MKTTTVTCDRCGYERGSAPGLWEMPLNMAAMERDRVEPVPALGDVDLCGDCRVVFQGVLAQFKSECVAPRSRRAVQKTHLRHA